jgi:hypothetical protein
MVHRLAALTDANPAAGYCGLLAASPESALASVLRLAVARNVTILPAKAVNPAERWQVVDTDDGPAIDSPQTANVRLEAPDQSSKAGELEEGGRLAARPLHIGDDMLELLEISGRNGQLALLVQRKEIDVATSGATAGRDARHDAIAINANGLHIDVSRDLIIDGTQLSRSGEGHRRIDVTINLSGDRSRDLDIISQVHAVLDRHQGPLRTHLILRRLEFKRVVERDSMRGTTWSDRLNADLTALLGNGAVALIDQSG